MGRARKGVIQLDDGRWTAALPIAVGANRRVQFTDTSEAVVRRWYADGEAALSTHRPPPSPDAYRARKAVQEQQRLGPRLRSAAWWAGATGDDGHLFDKVANAWAEQRYGKLRRAQPERHAAVLAIIGNDLSPWLKSRGVITIQGIENQLVADLATELAGRAAVVSVVAAPWPHLDGRRELAAQEAYSLVGVSRSTVSRWRRDGLLPSWHVDGADGRARVLVTELRAARMAQQTREQVERVGVFSSTAQNKLNVLGHILDFAKANGVQVTGDPMSGITSVKSEAEIAAAKVKTKHLPLGHVRDIAAHLPVVQQLTLWLERILGVRIGEGFGPFVGDVVDFGDVAGGVAGCLVIDKQGGRPFQILDNGVVVRRPSKEALKTSESERVVPLPRQLMTLLRVVLAAFHTDPATGELDMTARLVPGMRVHDESGQQAHRNALDRAVDAAGVDETKYGRIHPHRFRADLITDLERAGVDGVAARRFVGHVAGDDVHEREYMLDPADITPEAMAPFRDIIATLEGLVDSELGGTLMVPTAERETWGRGNRLYPQREHIYATLAAACWYLEPQADDGQPLATTEDVATALDVAPGTARRWMRTGELPGRLVRRDGRDIWCMTHEALAAVVAERRSSPTPTELAGELGLTYHQLYALMRDNGITGAQKSRRGDIRLSRDDVALLRVHHSRIADLNRRSMPLSVAAVELGVPVAVLETALRRGGVLDLDEEASTPTARLVTRESVAAYAKTRRRAAAPVPADAATVSAVQARAITGLTRPGLASLVQAGILVTVSRDRRMCVTRASIVTWAERCGRDDILPRLRQLADG